MRGRRRGGEGRRQEDDGGGGDGQGRAARREAGRARGRGARRRLRGIRVEKDLPGVTHGPKLVSLGNGTELNLPAGFDFADGPTVTAALRESGDPATGVVGGVFATEGDWQIIIMYEDRGHVTDSDSLDADALLADYKSGTEKQNEQRKQHGVPPLFVDKWMQAPIYDRPTHTLSWGIEGHDEKAKVINYTTTYLGRTGVLTANLIDGPETLAATRERVKPVLAGFQFTSGQRYEDYREGDHSSGVGLGAIVLGGAGVAVASKTGILLAIIIALKKGIIFIAVGIAAVFRKIFGIKKKQKAQRTFDDGTPPAV